MLEVPKPERGGSYQIHLKSGAGQIYVVLVNRDRDSEEPLVMQVSRPVNTTAEWADGMFMSQVGNVLVFVKLIFGPWSYVSAGKKPNIASLETSYQLWSILSLNRS